jgi:predicted transcriptional regulator
MLIMVNIRIDPRMKKALETLADKQFISMSAAIKQAIDRYLEEHGVDWRKEKLEEEKEPQLPRRESDVDPSEKDR